MARRKKDDTVNENTAPVVAAVFEEAPAPKKRVTRKKKEEVQEPAKEKSQAVKKPAVRKPRKKDVAPNFVIQDSSDNSITYEEIIKRVNDAASDNEVSSLDIYVKADEGKAYYVINGDIAGAVELF